MILVRFMVTASPQSPLAGRICRAGAYFADHLAGRVPSESMRTAAEPLLRNDELKGESRVVGRRNSRQQTAQALVVTSCCFVACSWAICMLVGRATASLLEPLHVSPATSTAALGRLLLEASP